MVIRWIFSVVFALALSFAQAYAQSGSSKTPAVLQSEVNTLWADNIIGQITPFNARQTLLDLILSNSNLNTTSGANTLRGNPTGGSAAPSDVAVPACNSSNSALQWTSGTGFSCGSLPFTTGINAQSGNYSVVAGDCGKTVAISGGPFTVTLLSAASVSSGCRVDVCNTNANANTQHAVLMSGFPNPVMARLYMGQCTTVQSNAVAWSALSVPGRFRPTFVPTLYVDNGGSNNNDGLISNGAANALASMQQCLSLLQNEYDLVGQQPICAPTGGQTIVGSFAQIGTNLASSVFSISGNGGVADLRVTAGSPAVLQMEDFSGYVITTNVTFDCTGGASTCIDVSFHQESGADFNNGTSFTGHSANDQAINCDGRCKVNLNSDASSAVIFSGSFLNAIAASQNSTFVAFNGLTLNNGASIAGDYFTFQQGVRFQFRGALNGGTGTSVGGSVIRLQSQSTACLTNFTASWSVAPTQKFTVLNGGMLYNVSANALPGTAAGVVSGVTGFAPGFAPDGAGGNTGVNAGGC